MTTKEEPNIKYDAVVAIDDHPAVLFGLKTLLEKLFTQVYNQSTAETGLKVVLEKKPSLVILDYHLASVKNGSLCREIKYRLPETKILGFSYDGDESVVNQLFTAGINGFMLKRYSLREIQHAIVQIMNGNDFFCEEAKVHLLSRIGLDEQIERLVFGRIKFTKTEVEIMRMLCKQFSNKEIGHSLNLSEKTIELYRSGIIKKTNSKNLAGVIKFSLQTGIIKMNQL